MLNFNQIRRFLTVFAATFFLSNIGLAQKADAFSGEKNVFDEMPEIVCFPNPAYSNSPVTIKIASPEIVAAAGLISVRITNEQGRVLFSAELPEKLEFTPSAYHFTKGNFYLQYYQNGRLFQTEELRVE